jgi:small subunit ribosomal protein S1
MSDDSSPAAAAPEQTSTPPSPPRRIGSQRSGQPKIQSKPQYPAARADQPPPPKVKVAPPNMRQQLEPEDELELAAAMGESSLDEMLDPAAATKELEPDSRHVGTVVAIHQDDVFVDFGGANQGVVSLRQFPEPPEVGAKIPVVVGSFNAEEGLYAASLSGTAAVHVEDWSQVSEGMFVDARVTGHNKGGLECDVNKLRGFIPASQIGTFRVEDFAPFVGQTFTCIITEANPEKRNLVLSRRAVLEREKQAARENAMKELAEGQIREGTVTNLLDFGAFVDIGGVEGLVHISQLSWQRVKHPSEVLTVGQRVKVLVRKIDQATGKIGLAMRDLVESPWATVSTRWPVTSVIRGRVTKIMDFGAFVELEPGIEGLVHISELSHGRVFRVSDVVHENDMIEAKVLSIDAEQQRISLSMKAIQARPEPKRSQKEEEPEIEEPAAPLPQFKNLKGGVERPSGGSQFGLKW